MSYCSSWCWCQASVYRSTLSICCCETMYLAKSQSLYNFHVLKSEHVRQEGRLRILRRISDGMIIIDGAVRTLPDMLWATSAEAWSWFSVQCKALAPLTGNLSTSMLSVSPCSMSGWSTTFYSENKGGLHREPTGEVRCRQEGMLPYLTASQNGCRAAFRRTGTYPGGWWRPVVVEGMPALLGWVCWWLYELCFLNTRSWLPCIWHWIMAHNIVPSQVHLRSGAL